MESLLFLLSCCLWLSIGYFYNNNLIKCDLAQLVEQFLHAESVTGSKPVVATKFNASLTQLVEYQTFNLGVPSSNLGGRTIFNTPLAQLVEQ